MGVVPSPHTLGVRRFTAGAVDEFGNATDAWADPVPWRVRSVAPATSDEPGGEHRDLSVVIYTVHADKTADVPGVRDLVVIDGKEYPVDGEPDDWTRGPWANPVAGVAVWVRRADGLMAAKLKFNLAAFRELRTSPGVRADIERRAKRVADAAGPGCRGAAGSDSPQPCPRCRGPCHVRGCCPGREG